VILLFGAKRLPDSARALGKSLRIFRSEVKEMQSDASPLPDPRLSATTAPPPASTY
jgi:sec-independent protein translocase protein TatA